MLARICAHKHLFIDFPQSHFPHRTLTRSRVISTHAAYYKTSTTLESLQPKSFMARSVWLMFDVLPPLALCGYIMWKWVTTRHIFTKLLKCPKCINQEHQKPFCYQHTNSNNYNKRLRKIDVYFSLLFVFFNSELRAFITFHIVNTDCAAKLQLKLKIMSQFLQNLCSSHSV